MPSAAKQKPQSSAALATVIRRHPALCVISLVVCLIASHSWKQQRDEAAYARSPAGRAEAKRAAEKARRDTQNMEDSTDVELAQSFVKNRLRDPDSAQFLAVHMVRRNGEKGVCGYVNSRNGFGGMAGNEAFAVIDVDVILANDAYPKDLKRLDRLCYGR